MNINVKKINTILAVSLVLGFSGYLSAEVSPGLEGNFGMEQGKVSGKSDPGKLNESLPVRLSTPINVLDFGASGSEYETTAET
ncbi:MAG: hypothetical protein M0R39_13095, partial [Prolixibacteraceae bacterium]|nr:hypothetical protein [Prolixibacteraceae bacterium]